MTSPGVGGESLRPWLRACGGAALGILGGGAAAIRWRRDCSEEPSRKSLQRLFTVDDGSQWSYENKRSGAIDCIIGVG